VSFKLRKYFVLLFHLFNYIFLLFVSMIHNLKINCKVLVNYFYFCIKIINTSLYTDSDTETASERGSEEEKKLLNEDRCMSSYSEPISSTKPDELSTIDTNEATLDRPQSTHGYYHPKKTQFKHYMMFNSENNKLEKTPEKKLTLETSPISPASNEKPSTHLQANIVPRQINFGNY
jgi:hypothetical protein